MTFRHTVVSRINSQSFASLGCPVSLQSLQHLQTGLLEGAGCFGTLHLSLVDVLKFLSISSLLGRCLASPVVRRSSKLTTPLQFDPEFQTPLILDESLDFSDPEESQFPVVFSDGLLAKSEPILPMSAFQKPPQAGLLGKLSTEQYGRLC